MTRKRQGKPDYMIHESRYQSRRARAEYAGWFTEADYEQDMARIEAYLAKGYAPTSGRLLDLGCGAGNYSWRFARRGYDVTGVDISTTAIQWATENAAKAGVSARFIVANVVDLTDVPDASFEFAFDGHLLHCLIGEDRRKFLAGVVRALKSRGYFMVRSIVWPVASTDDVVVDPRTKIGYVDGVPWRFYPDVDELLDELRTSGFEIMDSALTLTLDDGYGFQHAVVQCRVAR